MLAITLSIPRIQLSLVCVGSSLPALRKRGRETQKRANDKELIYFKVIPLTNVFSSCVLWNTCPEKKKKKSSVLKKFGKLPILFMLGYSQCTLA